MANANARRMRRAANDKPTRPATAPVDNPGLPAPAADVIASDEPDQSHSSDAPERSTPPPSPIDSPRPAPARADGPHPASPPSDAPNQSSPDLPRRTSPHDNPHPVPARHS